MRLGLDFHGVRGLLETDDKDLLEDLRRDFEFFVREEPGTDFRVRLLLEPPPAGIEGRRSFGTAQFEAYDNGPVRTVDYGEEARGVLDFSAESGRIYSRNRELLRELGYLMTLSRAGYLLDRAGMHRIHALGFTRAGRGALVLLPSGGGKTALCLDLLRGSDARILSEDTPLVSRDGLLHPFPLRLGLAPGENLSGIPEGYRRRFVRRRYGEKVLVDLPYFKDRVSGPAAPSLLVLGARAGSESPGVRRAFRPAAMGALMSCMVVGVGTPQLREYMLRKDAAGAVGLGRAALSRLSAAISLLARCRVARMRLGTDRARNTEVLLKLLEETG